MLFFYAIISTISNLRNLNYTIFEYKIAPTYDFIQEVLSHGNQLEVISPDAFRQQVKAIIQEMRDFYE